MATSKTTFQKYSDITDDEYKKLEKEHGKLVTISVPLSDEDDEDYDPDNVAKYILKRNPRRSVLKSIRFHASKDHPDFDKIEKLGQEEVLLAGDMIYLDPDKGEHAVYMAVTNAVGKMINGRTAKVGKR
jgi:hypothetical protein